ncbi:hypothetical protein [Streptomyces lacrimifluminis]|uniref:hypothetical protein n=1 Tax=Streptomyces lacrimifluminis TaxID=1500077 RepID=UPI00166E2E22|nr:hypothetical protein [Streptomyces lacrimifluminis]
MTHDMDLNLAVARLESHIRVCRAEGLRVSDVLWARAADALAVRIEFPSWQVQITVELRGAGRARAFFLSAAEPVGEPPGSRPSTRGARC